MGLVDYLDKKQLLIGSWLNDEIGWLGVKNPFEFDGRPHKKFA